MGAELHASHTRKLTYVDEFTNPNYGDADHLHKRARIQAVTLRRHVVHKISYLIIIIISGPNGTPIHHSRL